MANLVTFAKKLWKDATSGGTPITAKELNRMEGGINDCATQINKLGDSVSRTTRMGTTCHMAQIDQTETDVIKVIVDGAAGNYVMCLRKNKEMELYDRTNGRVLWVTKLP